MDLLAAQMRASACSSARTAWSSAAAEVPLCALLPACLQRRMRGRTSEPWRAALEDTKRVWCLIPQVLC